MEQRVEIFDIVLKLIFKLSPAMFDAVFIRRIRCQPNDDIPIKSGDFFKDRLSVPFRVYTIDIAPVSE